LTLILHMAMQRQADFVVNVELQGRWLLNEFRVSNSSLLALFKKGVS
jgi:hypothetical protein